MRQQLNIDKNLIMRKRGIDKLERTEIWCPSRTIAVKLQKELLGRSTKKEGHISIGQNFSCLLYTSRCV